jgi:hypothetical protein
MLRIYLLPLEVIGTARGPKYFVWKYNQGNPVHSTEWGLIDYGFEPTCMMVAQVTQADHDFLAVQSDVYAFPENIDATLGGQVSSLRTAMEAFNIPADWINASKTFREVIHMIAAVCLLMQRIKGILGNWGPFTQGGYSLSTKFSEMSLNEQGALSVAFGDMGFTSIDPADNLRKLLRDYGDAWAGKRILIGGNEL